MAVLSDSDRFEVWRIFMRDMIGTVSVSKADLRAAVDAIDDFFENNANTLNQAIPQPARGSLSTKQKALLFMLVLTRRYLFS